MKNKWLIGGYILFLAIAIFYCPVLAQEKIALDISRMIDLAISNNLNFKKASYQLDNVELDASQLEAENLLAQSGMLNRQKELNILQQQNTFQNQKDELIIQVVDNYFQLMLAAKDITRKEKNVELERAVLSEVEAQVTTGYSIDLDLLQQGNAYYDALFSYEKAKLDYQQLLIEVKNNLGLTQETEISVRAIEIPQLPEIDLATALSKSRENSLILKSKVIEVELNRIRLEKARIDREPQLEIVKLENNLEIVKLEKSILEQELNFQVLTRWQNYQQSKNDILLCEQSLKQMKENELIINRQVQAGLRTVDELLSADIGVLDAEYRLISSVRQYYQTYLELQRIIGILDEGEIK
ncbi:MAG: TolC family protein [Atribacterota bacterium]|nr:TolC family protein [Atribacterota bacterium]MDD5637349.1 TolC family protein [Atribacterota bacterium]